MVKKECKDCSDIKRNQKTHNNRKHILISNCMQSLILRPRSLLPYVPIRTAGKRECVANAYVSYYF